MGGVNNQIKKDTGDKFVVEKKENTKIEEKKEKKKTEKNSRKFHVFKDLKGIEKVKHYGFLPNICIHNILLYLSGLDLFSVYRSCKLFNIIGNSNLFFKEYYKNFLKNSGVIFNDSEMDVNFKELLWKSNYKNFFFKEKLTKLRKDQYWKKKNEILKKKYFDKGVNVSSKFKRKLICLGHHYCGKTTYLGRFLTNTYSDNEPGTCGAEFFMKYLFYNGKELSLEIWDYSGYEHYISLIENVFKHFDGVIFFFDLSDPKSLEFIPSYWLPLFQKNVNQKKRKYKIQLVGLKSDLNHLISDDEIIKVLIHCKLDVKDYCEVSAKESKNIFFPIGKITRWFYKTENNED